MKKSKKTLFFGLGLLGTLFVASSCTANFCTEKEKARLMYSFESGVSQFYIEGESELENIANKENYKIPGTSFYQVVQFDEETRKPTNNELLKNVIETAQTNGVYLPTVDFYKTFDRDFLFAAIAESNSDSQSIYPNIDVNSTSLTYTNFKLQDLIYDYAYVKFYSAENDSAWGNYDAEVSKLRESNDPLLGYENCPSVDFVDIYKNTVSGKINTYRSCITTVGGQYGPYGDLKKPIQMDKTTWKDAWGKGGHIIEGLIVYPVAWLLDSFANLFVKAGLPVSNGVPQILALTVVTIIVRLFIFLVTIKSTLSQQKMTALQPELAKIQQKYPNANTNQAQKQRMAEEQMRVYKKNGVNPLSSLIVLIVQFPIFIGVWGAMQGSAVLSTGEFLNLGLSTSIWECLKLGPKGNVGWWTALVLILLMSAGQFFSMKVPQWLQKAKTKKVSRLTKNPAEKEQNKTANIVSYAMLFMIIFMGFTLPAAMGVYWLIGALFSLVQSLIMNAITSKKQRK